MWGMEQVQVWLWATTGPSHLERVTECCVHGNAMQSRMRDQAAEIWPTAEL